MTKFDRKSTTGRTVVNDETPAAGGLTPEEERVLRMRSGAGVPGEAPLGSKLDGLADDVRTDVEARLRLIQAAVLEALAESDADVEGEPRTGPAVDGARKARIVSALKKKPVHD